MSVMDALKTESPDATEQRQLEVEKAKLRRQRQAKRDVDAEEHPPAPLQFLSEAQFDNRPPAVWLVHGLVLEASLGLVVGDPGTGKTFTMLDLALSIAAGHPSWLGRRLTKSGPVVYVAAEGTGRFKYRRDVWKQHHQVTKALPFYVLPHPVDLRNVTLMAEFVNEVSTLRPILVIFDTLNRCLPGAEENSAKEYGEAIAACGEIQRATGATVLLLHHPRKDGTSARGSGAGLGAVDTELWLKRTTDKSLVTMTCGKQKEGDDDLLINLKKKVIELEGQFENGEPITSCVYELADAADLTRSVDILARRIVEFVRKYPNTPKGDVAKHLGMKRKTVDDAIAVLLLDGDLVENRGGTTGRAKLLNVPSATILP